MAKFNINKISGMKNGIGAGLLSEASKELKQNFFDIVYLKLDDIEIHDRNNFSVNEDDILELMASINSVGLKQNLDVILKDEKYRVTTGKRRLIAMRKLRDLGRWGDVAPCTITVVENIDLPLSADSKEDLIIIETNRQRRKYTDYDTLTEIQTLNRIFTELRSAGYEEVDMPDGQHLVLKGTKNRELIAEKLQMSKAQVGKFNKVENNAATELLNEFEQGNVNVNVANEIASLAKEEQKEFINNVKETEGTLDLDSVRNFKKTLAPAPRPEHDSDSLENQNEEVNETGEEIKDPIDDVKKSEDNGISIGDIIAGDTIITLLAFEQSIKEIVNKLQENDAKLSSKKYKKYVELMENLINIFKRC